MKSNESAGGGEEVEAFSTRVFNFFARQWKSILFTSGLALILEHHGLMQVLVKFSWLVVSSLASQGPAAAVPFSPGMPAVVLLDDAAFVSRYAEKSPLDRCLLGDDLERILAKSPRIVAVDFDLSPLVRMNEGERQCQERLDGLLDREAARLLLLVPFPAATPEMYQVKHAWMRARCHAGLHFADGTIEQSMGLVTEQVIGQDPAAGARFADQLHSGLSAHVCDSVGPAHGAAALNSWLVPRTDRSVADGEEAPINFPEVIRKLAVLTLDSPQFAGLASLAGSAVVFGGSWGKDDLFLTAIGSLPGAVLHALRMVSLADPIHPMPPVLGLLFDIGIALCFAWVVHYFWDVYVKARRIDRALADQGRLSALSTFMMFLFVAVYVALVLLFFLAAQHLYLQWKVLIAPLLIALGILVDGFVTGPVDQIDSLLEESGPQPASAGQVLLPAAWTIGLLGVLAFLYGSRWVDLRQVAGQALIFGQLLLYGLMAKHLLWDRWRARGNRDSQTLGAQGVAALAPGADGPRPMDGPPIPPAAARLAMALAIGRSGVFWIVMVWAAWALLVH